MAVFACSPGDFAAWDLTAACEALIAAMMSSPFESLLDAMAVEEETYVRNRT